MSVLGGIAAFVSAIVPLPVPPQGTPAQAGQWTPLIEWGVQGKHMVLLPTGDVLVWPTGDKARVWDPETGNFTLTPATFGDLHCAGHVTLPDGRPIVLGGTNVDTHIGLTVTAIFDYTLNRWTQGRPMNFPRWYASVTALADGRILVTSGDDGTGQRVLTPEIYDPVQDTWVVLTNAVRDQSLYPLMYVLPDGRVYECGPKSSTVFLNMNGTGSWTNGPASLYSTSGYSESAAMYLPGKILRAGGDDPAIARASVIDMTVASPQWRDTSPMHFPRRRLNLVILADGKCLAVGGTREADSEAQAVLESEIWDPATGQWTVVAGLAEPRMYHSAAILLPDGRVVSAGGEGNGRDRAQIYSPPYLFQGTRPVITSAPAGLAYGTTFEIDTPTASSITSVALLRQGAATHAWDQNQRYVPLTFGLSGSRLSVSAPPSGNVAPPGYYMLVIKNIGGIPSVARFLRLGSSQDLAPGAISGTVTSASTLAPIAGVSVVTSERTTTTAANGSYTLDPISSGEHLVTFSAPGYATVTRSAEVQGGSTTTLNVSLAQPGQVVGTVTDANTGAPIAGALIVHAVGTTTTDASGHYTADGLPAGSQSLTASAAGHTSLQKSATVLANGSVTLDFALVPSQTYIAGGVIDAGTSLGIAGATVSYSGGTRTTDSLGRYRFDDVVPGTHHLTASAPGYLDQSADVLVIAGAGSFHDFGLGTGATRIKDITFEGGSLTDPTTGADRSSGPVLLETAGALAGGFSGRVKLGSAYIEETFTLTSELFVVMSFKFTTLPVGDARILRVTDNGTTVGTVQLRSSGRLRLRNGSNTVGVETAALVAGTTYRVGLHQRQGTGANAVLEAFLSTGSAAFGAPFAALANGTWKTAADKVQVGTTTITAADFTFDDIRIDSGSMPGGGPPTAPVAAFSATPTTGTAPLTVAFSDTSTGSITSRSWSFGDGTTSTATSPSKTYSTPGSYTVTLTVTGPGGSDPETKSNYITVNAPVAPVAAFSATPTSGTAPLTVQFTDASTGSITSRSWSFGDGTTSTATSPSKTYSTPGSYTVTLTVTGPGGSDPETKSNYITVNAPVAPVAAFSATPTSGTAPLTVQFTDASTGSITSRSWSFGDGTTSTATSPSKTYSTPGSYTVTLTVTGPGGSDPETKSNYITVNAPVAPVAAFSATPTSGTAPLAVQFTDTSTGNVSAWSWTFGDGTSSNVRHPSHSYAAGTFTVSLTATGPGGSNTVTKTAFIVANSTPPPALVLTAPVPGTAGMANTLQLSGALPNSNVTLLTGEIPGSSVLANASCPSGIPIGLGTPYRVLNTVRTSVAGTATFTINPGTATAGKLFYFQAVEPATCKASNVASDRL